MTTLPNSRKLRATFSVLTLVFIAQMILAACGPTGDPCNDYTTTIYTPNGSPVTAIYVSCELSESEIAEHNWYVESNYPWAIRETDASRKYNCHSYAWHNQAPSNNIWINTPNEDTYWLDGSYYLITTGYGGLIPSFVPNGAKVSYVMDDHSAIKVSSTHFRSKWGELPRMLHEPNYSPYDASELNYYTR